ncbi:helix-turn-helix transcriptional regulator [Myxococcus sp. K38C18041901]|uniref:helix-turn-helix domain-containing protein n=1 Tax=Myxococcus guangdongensis TaxID=2906760 RepID=UPI0020A7B6BF|nr:helix-turn-helix domain-containing protein [Myxococcus guangdongensis]MCP3065307.1 helix-turn-helix transcriptional regulator [Myxococcus guangdongensis]
MNENTKSLVKQVGKYIQKQRTERKLTQEELAERADISVSYLSMLERGERAPHLQTLLALSAALDVSVATLVSLGDAPQEGDVSAGLRSFITYRGLSASQVGQLESVARVLFPAGGDS